MATINATPSTLTSALSRAVAGDTVVLAAGEYRGPSITINRAITLKGGPGVIIRPTSSAWNGITVTAHNVTVEDLEIVGARGDGIEANNVHHFTARRLKVSGCGESGVQTNYSDWITVEGCECTGNARDTWASGISLYQCRNLAAGTAEFRNIVRGNICRDNVTLPAGGPHTDGNGIIIDDFQHTQTSGFPNYTFPTLVENNLCAGNGGKGIQVTWSDNVTVRGNTCVGNNVDPNNDGTWRGDLSISQSKGASVIRNIAVCKRGSGRLASNRAYDDTSTSTRFNSTTYSGNVGWDASGTPSVRTDGGQSAPVVQWIDPQLGADFIPRIATTAGWRPAGVVIPPNPEPEPMTLEELIAAFKAYVEKTDAERAALTARVTALEAVGDTALAERVAAVEAWIDGMDKAAGDMAGLKP